ncbi:hypothetical protein OHA74_18275 [Streptomyces phaeochromogenes]|uniref:hypothetical protein n=1 Tax=Streptomyces phaeochromogenes TaxID=1923 RepID=UPI002E2C7D5E|nr:hypothetical protein [Streptomyces phaeochromogenes]
MSNVYDSEHPAPLQGRGELRTQPTTTRTSPTGLPPEGFAECVLCQKPTEYPESYRGTTLCPVCEWQEAQRTACSG